MNQEKTRDSQPRPQPPYQPRGTAISYRVCNRRINRSKFSRGRDFENRGSFRRGFFLPLRAILFLALCFIPLTAHAREAKESARIEHLISSVEKLSGAKFIRNGTEYDPKKAGEHLRMKLKKGGEKVKTAENFIDGIAAKSSVSGKDYKIRKPDGTLVTTSAYFYARLKEYDSAKSAP
jgi:hypothetical protein